MPSISSAELFWGSDIEQQIAKGSLQGIESKVQEIKGYNSKPDSNIRCLVYV